MVAKSLQCTVHPFVYSVKLKLEFIVLNQLLTLVKRGMAPGNLPALAGDSKNASDSDSGKPVDSPMIRAQPEQHRHSFLPQPFRFSSKAARSREQAATTASSGAQTPSLDSRPESAKNVEAKADDVVLGSVQTRRSDSDQTLPSDETDLIKVVGVPDEDEHESVEGIDDMEKQYLGRFGMPS
jgi:hypothetical protein